MGLDLLILGGSGFIGTHQVRHAQARGHRVTLFNRGRRQADVPPGVTLCVGDREHGDYAALAGRHFDACIDNSASVPRWVRDAADTLAGRVRHWLFVSTISVYADGTTPGQDEDAPRLHYGGADVMAETLTHLRADMALYGPLKAACEDEVQRRFGHAHSTIVRPGLIVGPGDETDRFSYWPLRVRRGGPVLVPPLHDPAAWIDARDLAEWTVHLVEQQQAGVFNAVGPATPATFGEVLAAVRNTTGGDAHWVQADADWLAAQQVAPWADLPLWLPGQGQTAGFHRRSNTRALAAGLRLRPLTETTHDLLAWWDSLPAERQNAPLRAGLPAAREAELLQLLNP